MNLHDGYRKQFVVNRQELLLIHEAGQSYLIQSSCPHLHWPLITASIHDGSIFCPKHGMAFSLLTGKGTNERANGCQPLKTFPLVYEGMDIGIWLEN